MSERVEAPLLTMRFGLALQFANQIHAAQTRKGVGAPYISHLMAVCALVLEAGGSEDQAIAALLHDAAEDCGGRPMLEAVRVTFGEEVAEIVDACTDSFSENAGNKAEWRPRKEAYLARLADKPDNAKLVSCADKYHNLSHTLRDIENEGVDAWRARMSQSKNGAAEKQVWYYLGCLDALSNGWTCGLLKNFASAVRSLCSLVGQEADQNLAQRLSSRLS